MVAPIRIVILPALPVAPHVLSRKQPHLVTQILKLACPIIGTPTDLHDTSVLPGPRVGRSLKRWDFTTGQLWGREIR